MRLSAKGRADLHWSLAASLAIWGLVQLISPPQPPFTGKWGWFNSLVSASIGWTGFAIFLFGTAAAMLYLGLQAWRSATRESKHRAG